MTDKSPSDTTFDQSPDQKAADKLARIQAEHGTAPAPVEPEPAPKPRRKKIADLTETEGEE